MGNGVIAQGSAALVSHTTSARIGSHIAQHEAGSTLSL